MQKETRTCPHGRILRDNSHLAGRVMAAPYSECRCCFQTYYYIDSGSWTMDGIHGKSFSKDLCPSCGGHYTEY